MPNYFCNFLLNNVLFVSQLQMLQEASKNSPDDEEALRAIDLLYDAALVSSGFTVSNIIPLFYLHTHFQFGLETPTYFNGF